MGSKSTPQITPVRAPIPRYSGNSGGNSRKRDINSSVSGHFHVGKHETLFGCIWAAKREGERVLACLPEFSGPEWQFSGFGEYGNSPSKYSSQEKFSPSNSAKPDRTNSRRRTAIDSGPDSAIFRNVPSGKQGVRETRYNGARYGLIWDLLY
jgi:hypothetical protein